MGLLGRIFGGQEPTPEQRARLSELKESLMDSPKSDKSIRVYTTNLGEYRQALRGANGKESEEYGLMISVFEGMLQRAQSELGKKHMVEIR